MSNGKVYITDYGFPDLEQERELLMKKGYEVVSAVTSNEEDIIANACDADAVLVQWAPLTERVISNLKKCRIIVRYGIGVDNIDLEAARKRSIPVCNVPDYCVNEVADHTISLALALARQLTETNARMKKGEWKIIPPYPMPAFRDMLFATIGFGRIAREVLKRARSFEFTTAAYDPNIPCEEIEDSNVKCMSFEDLISTADIISLHLPLNQNTHHLINANTISRMKKGTILLNTSRGGLIDTSALVYALKDRKVAAGLDVFETEPLPAGHPLWNSEHVLLTSHTAWYSSRSVPQLQALAAEEILRGLRGEALKNRVV